MAKLNPKQQAALDWVAETDERYRKAKFNARTELKRLVEERVAEHAAARNQAVAQAFELGVPKTRIGQEGLHTTSPNTVYDILEKHRELMELTGVELAVKPADKFSWGVVLKCIGPKEFAAWVLEDGEEFESELGGYTHPGWAVLASPGSSGNGSYTVFRGDEFARPVDSREKYPDLIAWIESYPPVVEA